VRLYGALPQDVLQWQSKENSEIRTFTKQLNKADKKGLKYVAVYPPDYPVLVFALEMQIRTRTASYVCPTDSVFPN
jgi:hypothetical protein